MDIRTLNNLTYGMYVVTTKYNDKKIGCFVNTVTQVTAQNPIISISISKNNYTSEAMQINRKIGISILSEKTDPKVIGKFGFFSSKDVDKFDDIEYIDVDNIPIINENICGYLICQVLNIVDVETHNIVLARVIDAKILNEYVPMTYSYYHNVIKGKVPKNAPTYKEVEENKREVKGMEKYKCTICGYIYDEEKEGIKFSDLPEDWVCPLCGVGKNMFEKM